MDELQIKGMGISREVVATIVEMAAAKVAGVAHVGQDMLTSSLISVFNSSSAHKEVAVESKVIDNKLALVVHVTVFFGYQFVELADAIRASVAQAVIEHIGVDVASVDVCIDSLVFPKEK